VTIRVLLADDHEVFLEGLRALLDSQRDLEVVGTCRDGRQAVDAARALSPDVVVMDAAMPEMNGMEATRRITERVPGIKIICLSMHAEPRFVEGVLDAGACGYLPKECPFEEVARAIRHVARNRTYLSPNIAGVVIDALRTRRSMAGCSAFERLSEREREILQLLAEGHAPRDIAERLHLSIKTVATHREHIMDKLGIHNIAGLTKFALLEGVTSPEPRDHDDA
jgi:DNA-binding NarL/FixJ family response regulator